MVHQSAPIDKLCIARQFATINLCNNQPSARAGVVSLEESRLNITRFDLRYDDLSRRYNFVEKTKLWRFSATSYSPRQVQPSGTQNLGQPPTHEILINFDPPMLLQSSFGLLISTCSFEDGYVHPGLCVMFCAKVFSDFFGNIPGDFLVDSACILTQDSRMCLPKRLSILAHRDWTIF